MANVFDLMDEWGPEKIVAVSDAKTGMKGVLVIDNTARGIGKGGTRMQPTVSVDEIARLARVMTWKWAGVDLFYGGAKAGIQADPASPYKEEILRAFVRRLRNEVPEEYVFGLDMGLTENDAAIINDELGTRGAAVGTPYELGGIPYDQLGITGYGVAEVVDQAAAATRLPGRRVALQGFGAVGHAAAERLHTLGYQVVSVSTAAGALHDPNGLDIPSLLELRRDHGDAFVSALPELKIEAGTELFVDADIVVPAALQDVIDDTNAGDIRGRLLVEGANLPTSPEAQAVLRDAGVTVVPDFVANAGGVVSAAFAMDARHSAFRPETGQIFETVSSKLRANTVQVLEETERRGGTSHEAARGLAQERVKRAMQLRGKPLPVNA
ncbi:Glu/Leu/Phe/Val family dehydrogenase [Arthrobacter sp. VKM Ac-2550]|uniref:Glu/Leu/Phe/Val family dehydrogenase n=1 Tax=Crystallibacter permensis TaxID=1938888 RepID=UPI002227C4EC|nr:Glu/Leu/Phe/Val dehydrogenase dimerization domain-containing protein [Arthrobacter sp. VKM Ac-2550]MCW2130863.1 glutamate dehydrogenase (NADP) [Arthrobacter sp. VKM Ac-2550]